MMSNVLYELFLILDQFYKILQNLGEFLNQNDSTKVEVGLN